MLDDPAQRAMVLSLLRAADVGITGVQRVEMDPAVKERAIRAVRILTGQDGALDSEQENATFIEHGARLLHQGSDGPVGFEPSDESLGTSIWFGLVGTIVQSLVNGSVLLADELDASLHPLLVRQIVRLFQDPNTNPNRAQLIFNSHDASLLGDTTDDRLLGRDQVWFTEKDHRGASRIYPLIDLEPRKHEAVARRYLAGRYGGTPILSHQDFDVVGDLLLEKDAHG
jgi:hypothetical protein